MRKALLFLLTIVCLAGCTDRHVREQLDRAERVVSDCPDSAFAILAALPDTDRLSTADRARRDLLMAEARYMADSTDTAPARLLETAAYFDLNNDPRNAARAYYYAGMQYRNKEINDSAYQSFLLANKYAVCDTSSHILIGKTYRALAECYEVSNNWKSVQCNYKLSFDEFNKCGPNKYADQAQLDLARAYFAVKEYDKTIRLATDLNIRLAFSDSTNIIPYSLSILARAYLEKGEYNQAIAKFEELITKHADYADAEDYMHLGLAYLWDSQIEKSKEYNSISLALDSTDKTLDFYLAHAMGNNEKAYDLLAHNIIPSQSSQIDSLYTNKDVEIITRHTLIEGKKAAQAISDEKNKQHLTILFSLFIFIVILSIFALKTNKNRLIRKTNEKLIYNLKENLLNLESLYQDSKSNQTLQTERLQTALRDRLISIDKLCSILDASKESPKREKIVYKEVEATINDFMSRDSIDSLEYAINVVYKGILNRFKEDIPDATPNERILFMCIILNLSKQTTSLFLKTKIESVYKRKYKLKLKIQQSGARNIEEYIQFF